MTIARMYNFLLCHGAAELGRTACNAPTGAETVQATLPADGGTHPRAQPPGPTGEAMNPSFSKTAVLDDLATHLADRRRHACERRLAYQRLARAIASQPQRASWIATSRGPRPRPIAAAA